MTATRHFSFDFWGFEEVIAHGGAGKIKFRRVLTSGDGGGYNFLDISIVPPGAEIGTHTHSLDNEEIYIIVSGCGRMRLDEEEFDVGPGHVVVNRPGGTHGLRNIGDSDLRLVVIEVPAGCRP